MTQKRELARVERAEAYWLTDGISSSLGRLVVAVHGTKPTSCHRVDLVPMQADSPSFAAAWVREGEFCLEQEVTYSYSESFDAPGRVAEIVLLSAGTGGEPEERKVAVRPLEPHSLRRLRAPLPAASVPNFDAASPGAETLRLLASHMQAVGPMLNPSVHIPFAFGGPRDAVPLSAANPRNEGKFSPGEAKWWNAGYSQCEIWIDIGDDRGRRYFRGKGGGFPGAGAFSGDLYTGNLGALLTQTTTCQIVSALFYVNISFWDAGSGYLGMFHGGGAGIGGGLLAGHWTT